MTRRVLILGAGGHGQMAADILLASNRAGAGDVPIGFLDDDERLRVTTVLGLPVLGAIEELDRFGFDAVAVAVGNNRKRQQIAAILRARSIQLANVIHPSAIISPDVRLGLGVFAAAGVIVNTGSIVADGVILSTACTVGHHNQIDEYVHIGPGAHLGGHVAVGPGAMVGIGGAVIPGKAIGAWAVVGAGAVVIDDIPSHRLAVGVPAKVIRPVEDDVEAMRPLPVRSLEAEVSIAPQVVASSLLPD